MPTNKQILRRATTNPAPPKNQRGSVLIPNKVADWADKTGDAVRAVANSRGVRGVATAAGKVGSRFIPVAGWGLAAMDAYDVGSYIYKNREQIMQDAIEQFPKQLKRGFGPRSGGF